MNMDYDLVWKPRWQLRPAVEDAVETAAKAADATKTSAKMTEREMIDLRTAMMRVLNRFPDALKPAREMFIEITQRIQPARGGA